MNGGDGLGLLSRKVECKMKRCLNNIYKDAVVTPNNGHTRSEAFVLCREVVLVSEVAI